MTNKKVLIFNALAFADGYSTSSQMNKYTTNSVIETYLKNSLVSLASAKHKNSQADCFLFVNVEVPDILYKEYTKFGVNIIRISFDKYKLSNEFTWALAFFKLKALDYAVSNLDYDYFMLLDSDTYTVNSYKDIWLEAERGILLYDIDHRVSHEHRQQIIRTYNLITGKMANINHYGGELIAGSHHLLKTFIKESSKVFELMFEKQEILEKTLGDEFIISAVAESLARDILRANKYIYRYWTIPSFYLVSTNYYYNSVDIWHLPTEKKDGIIKIYEIITKTGQIPDIIKSAKIMNLPSRHPVISKYVKSIKSKVLSKLGILQ